MSERILRVRSTIKTLVYLYTFDGAYLDRLRGEKWRCQLWGTGARAPFDFQQFHFYFTLE